MITKDIIGELSKCKGFSNVYEVPDKGDIIIEVGIGRYYNEIHIESFLLHEENLPWVKDLISSVYFYHKRLLERRMI